MVMSHLHIRLKLSDVIWLKYKLIWFEVFVAWYKKGKESGKKKKEMSCTSWREKQGMAGAAAWQVLSAGRDWGLPCCSGTLVMRAPCEEEMLQEMWCSLCKKTLVLSRRLFDLCVSSEQTLGNHPGFSLKFPDLGGDRGVPTVTWMCSTGSCWCPNHLHWEENSTEWLCVGWECQLCPGSGPWNSELLSCNCLFFSGGFSQVGCLSLSAALLECCLPAIRIREHLWKGCGVTWEEGKQKSVLLQGECSHLGWNICTSQLLPSKGKLGCDKIFLFGKVNSGVAVSLVPGCLFWAVNFSGAELLEVLFRPHLYWSQIILIANHLSELMSS